MGLILTTSILIFILILDALRNQICIHLKHDCITKQDKKRIVSKATEYYKTDIKPFGLFGYKQAQRRVWGRWLL